MGFSARGMQPAFQAHRSPAREPLIASTIAIFSSLRCKIITLALLLWAAPALANTCFSQERDPRTRKPYESEALWQADVDALWAEAPPMPWIFDLLHGNQVAQSESKVRAGSDKRRHCYVGCRIANEAGYHVAVYAGYFKEDQDLKDCDPATSYEPKDLAATILGADLARENPGRADKDYCLKQCRSEF